MEIRAEGKIFIATEPVDFRYGYAGLCGAVREKLQEDPMSRAWFVFFNKRRDQVKVLYFDATGYAIWMKRLSQGVFRKISSEGVKEEIGSDTLQSILSGVRTS